MTLINYRGVLWALLFCLIGSCATLPESYNKSPSYAINDTTTTFLGYKAAHLQSSNSGMAGLYPLSSGVEALTARLRLAEKSERSIDVQYYYILEDLTGGLLLDQLFKAAERGVRVRILLDDIATHGYEKVFAVLSAHPYIEIRLANPFSHRGARTLDFATDTSRIDHRMHNKSMTFDNAVTIVGGRNIAVEYFGDSAEFNYYDLDMLAVGDIAAEASRAFDLYWNAAETIPVTAFIPPDSTPESLLALQQKFADVLEKAKATPYAAVFHKTLLQDPLDRDRLTWAQARVIYDLPYGMQDSNGTPGPQILGHLLEKVSAESQQEFFLISPYFVPEKSGIEFFRALRERGVRCVVVTNSLASTDVSAVYAGYQRYQKPLLELGVELWEIKAFPADPGERRGAPSDRTSLHAKTFAVDRQRLFVGSFNWDPRSHRKNTEMGFLIESSQLASELATNVTGRLPDIAWQLRLSSNNTVEWVEYQDNGRETTFTEPPQTSVWRRLSSWLQSSRFIEGEL